MDDRFKTNNFDLLRILAATQVVCCHTVGHLGIATPPWWTLVNAFPGVPIFFAISGYLISASFERGSGLRTYARNRILRIYPGLWSVVLLTVLVASLFHYSFLSLRALGWFAAQLTGLIYTPGFLKSFGFGSYNGALWTIPIELQFYVLLPVFYAATRASRHRTAWFAAAWAVFAVAGYLFTRLGPPLAEGVVEPLDHKLLRYSFVPHIYLFLTGVLLQRLQAHRSRWIAGRGLYWLAAYVAFHLLGPGGALAYTAGFVLMAVATISAAYTAPGLSARLLRGNDISYGVYIYHGVVLNILVERGIGGHFGWLALVLAATFVLGFASWRLVERPFLRRKRSAIHPVGAPA